VNTLVNFAVAENGLEHVFRGECCRGDSHPCPGSDGGSRGCETPCSETDSDASLCIVADSEGEGDGSSAARGHFNASGAGAGAGVGGVSIGVHAFSPTRCSIRNERWTPGFWYSARYDVWFVEFASSLADQAAGYLRKYDVRVLNDIVDDRIVCYARGHAMWETVYAEFADGAITDRTTSIFVHGGCLINGGYGGGGAGAGAVERPQPLVPAKLAPIPLNDNRVRLTVDRYRRAYNEHYERIRAYKSMRDADIEAHAEVMPLYCRCEVCSFLSAEHTDTLMLAQAWREAQDFEHDGDMDADDEGYLLGNYLFVPSHIDRALRDMLCRTEMVGVERNVRCTLYSEEYRMSMRAYLRLYVYDRHCRCYALMQHMLAVLRTDKASRDAQAAIASSSGAKRRCDRGQH